MVKCDNCGFESREVTLGDGCPECGVLVGIAVPNAHSRGDVLARYDVEATDAELAAAIQAVAERNYATLLRRKRKAEQAIGIGVEQGSPPNAEPKAAAADPAVQPQPDGEGDVTAEAAEEDPLEGEEAAGV